MKIKLESWAKMPTRGHATDGGLDLRTPFAVTVPAGGSAVIDTGVHVEIYEGLVGMLKSKRIAKWCGANLFNNEYVDSLSAKDMKAKRFREKGE